MLLSLLIQDEIEKRIARLSRRSLNQEGDPYGSDSKLKVLAQHWVRYVRSSYPEGLITSYKAEFSQIRELEYEHYVEVQDFRRNYVRAQRVHEQLMGALAGFCPEVAGVQTPLRLVSDEVVSAKVEAEVVFRYRATYKILCHWVAGGVEGLEGDGLDGTGEPIGEPFIASGIVLGVFRSPIDQVAVTEVSPKFAEVIERQ